MITRSKYAEQDAERRTQRKHKAKLFNYNENVEQTENGKQQQINVDNNIGKKFFCPLLLDTMHKASAYAHAFHFINNYSLSSFVENIFQMDKLLIIRELIFLIPIVYVQPHSIAKNAQIQREMDRMRI